MAENNKQPRRPVAGSRNPSTAPRRIAGRSARPDVAVPPTESERAVSTAPEPSAADRTARKTPVRNTEATRTSVAEPSGEGQGDAQVPRRGALSGAGTTKVLVGLAVALLVVALVEAVTWAVAHYTGSDEPQHVLSFSEDYVVHDDPITVPMADWRDANDAAMKSVTEILNVSWKDYDQNLEDARKLITDRFEKEYASTTKDSRELFLKNKAEYDFAVVGTSVVEANPDEVATLLFLNQHVYKGAGKDRVGPEVYPVRVMVRMVRTDDGWLIDELHAL